MSEPDVTLTDYGLALECAICAMLLGRTPVGRRMVRVAGVGFYAFLGLSAAAGGTVQARACDLLWRFTLLMIGLAACSTWVLGVGVITSGRAVRGLALAAIPQCALYSMMVLLITQEFWVAFTIYLPAALLLLAGFCRAVWYQGQRFLIVGAAGSVLSLMSSFIQFMRIGINPVYFNHNALAHVVQAVALVLLFLGMRSVLFSDQAQRFQVEPHLSRRGGIA